MTPKQYFAIACIILSVSYELVCADKFDFKRVAKRIFYVTVSCYIAMEIILDK